MVEVGLSCILPPSAYILSLRCQLTCIRHRALGGYTIAAIVLVCVCVSIYVAKCTILCSRPSQLDCPVHVPPWPFGLAQITPPPRRWIARIYLIILTCMDPELAQIWLERLSSHHLRQRWRRTRAARPPRLARGPARARVPAQRLHSGYKHKAVCIHNCCTRRLRSRLP
jgi:hypothetical protein